ncbi:putative O-glycosylation ligase, exosortase A system-associated [Sphingomonas bacterium]|uniref:putative O-glycosylation ligase, exosortase A system-associated n=1 Tax=Sphingomonas bacterium TaxID=1895847 RepID=UPI00157704B4|nr:putative O-glycosylation ligase, exosortase A system-associated [Sphingomonas bacterium]
MHDLLFIVFLGGLFAMGLRRPFLLILAYVYIDIVSPQRLTYYLLNTVPISLIAVVMAVGGWALADDKSELRIAPRQVLIVVLMLYCGLTTLTADFPIDAQDKWEWVWKSLAFGAFLPFTLRTRLRIEALLLFMVLSAGAIIIVGGIKTVVTHGGGYGELDLMVNNNSGMYEGSTISMAAVALIPIIAWFARWGTVFPPNWRVKGFALALGFACLLIPIGTSTRTGLVCIGLLAVLELRNVKRKLLYCVGLATLAGAAVPFLPSAFTDRMSTIKSYQADESASTRIAVWMWTLDYAKQHPFGGGFYAFRGNHLRYELKADDGHGGTAAAPERIAVDEARAWHSAYFEMLGEQGYPGLLLWLAINLAGLVRMEVLRRRLRDRTSPLGWASALAGALQSAQLVYMLGASFVGIASNPFFYMLIGTQIGLDLYVARVGRQGMVPGIRQRTIASGPGALPA